MTQYMSTNSFSPQKKKNWFSFRSQSQNKHLETYTPKLELILKQSPSPIQLIKNENIHPKYGYLEETYWLSHSQGVLPVATAIDKIYVENKDSQKELVFKRQENGTYKDLRIDHTVDTTQNYLQAAEKFMREGMQYISEAKNMNAYHKIDKTTHKVNSLLNTLISKK